MLERNSMKTRMIRTGDSQQDWERLNPQMQRIEDKNFAHPSLKVHRLHQAKSADIWVRYIRVNKRLLYQNKGSTIYLWDVGEHSLVERIRLRSFDRLA
jgi:hypothetical protein